MEGNSPLVSVVVPVRDDAAALEGLLGGVPSSPGVEIIVSATEADEVPLAHLRSARPDVTWLWGLPGRGPQLNRGAAVATGRWLWFVHADSQPPDGWRDEFARLDADGGIEGGSFAFALVSAAPQARVLEWIVRWRVRLLGLSYGDQGLFVRRDVFEAMGGFAPLPLMEDVEFVRRLRRRGRVVHLARALRTSARRWEREGWWRRSARNVTTLALYALGMSPERLAARYDRQMRR